MRKTLEQERAFYCLKCVERLKLAKDGKWFELKDFIEYKLKPDSIETLWGSEWKRMTLFDGVRKEFLRSLVSQFFGEFREKENRRQEVNEIINLVFENLKMKNSERKLEENEVLKEIRNYIESGNSNLNEDIKKKINEFYIKFEPMYPDYASNYSSHAKRLSQMIISNGLIPTLAFYKSKGDDRGQIYTDICEILEVTGFKPYLDWKNNKEGSLLLEFLLLEADFQTLRLATMEVLAIANWLKRIVEVEIEE
jgi:CRISPR-associated protein Cmr5